MSTTVFLMLCSSTLIASFCSLVVSKLSMHGGGDGMEVPKYNIVDLTGAFYKGTSPRCSSFIHVQATFKGNVKEIFHPSEIVLLQNMFAFNSSRWLVYQRQRERTALL